MAEDNMMLSLCVKIDLPAVHCPIYINYVGCYATKHLYRKAFK